MRCWSLTGGWGEHVAPARHCEEPTGPARSGRPDDRLRAFFVTDVRSRNIPTDLENRLFRKLQMIDDARTDQDLRIPPSNHFEKLRGNLAGLHSIRVNNQWRLVFRWNARRGEAEDVYLDDHSYR